MKKPESLEIFGQFIPVEYIDNYMEDTGFEGEYCTEDKTIKMDSSLKGDQFWICLIHETWHGYCDRLSIGQAVQDQLEEIMADTWGKAMVENFNITSK